MQAIFSFTQIKKAISEPPILSNPDYTKPFNIFSFSYDTTLAIVLLQKNDNQDEQPFSFFSKVMRDVELKYDIIEKHAYDLVQDLKTFQTFSLHSPITAYVPNNVVKTILTQPDTDGRRGRWIDKILEFDLDIKSTKLIKGQGLAKLLVESNCKVLGINTIIHVLGEKNPQEPSPRSK